MKHIIRNRFTGNAICEGDDLKILVSENRRSLHEANLSGANLRGADLGGANLGWANLGWANLRGANLGWEIPIVSEIDKTILAAIEAPGNHLEMGAYHGCETTHCRAGWAVHLAGKSGYALEGKLGANAAGALIYAASRPELPVPDFFASNEDALADLRSCAERTVKP